MGIILWIVFGAIVGWLASILMKTNGQQGLLLDIIVGIVGSVIGGWLMSIVGGAGVQGFNLYSLLVALVGACALIAVVRAIQK